MNIRGPLAPLPKWLTYALTVIPIVALWAVNVWALNDYMRHKEAQEKDERKQEVRDAEQDKDLAALKAEIARQQRVTCAIAQKLNVASSDCL